jgi:transcriptional regulator with XRE-family HTH domain
MPNLSRELYGQKVVTRDVLARNLGRRIRRLREWKGWTRRELAGVVGVGEKIILSYEGGKHLPPVLTLLAIAQTFGVPVDELFRPADDESPHLRSPLVERFLRVLDLGDPEQRAAAGFLDLVLGLNTLVGQHLARPRSLPPAQAAEVRNEIEHSLMAIDCISPLDPLATAAILRIVVNLLDYLGNVSFRRLADGPRRR